MTEKVSFVGIHIFFTHSSVRHLAVVRGVTVNAGDQRVFMCSTASGREDSFAFFVYRQGVW